MDHVREAAEETWTVDEVAAYLRVSIPKVRKLVIAGQMPGTRVGQSYRFQAAEVRAYLRGEWKPAAPEAKSA